MKQVNPLIANRRRNLRRREILILVIVLISISLNLYTFLLAYPETAVIDTGCCANRLLAKDFSAYYIAAWRLFSNPTHLYTPGALNDGEPNILPQPENFKYLPSFLLFVSPLLNFDYRTALTIFDIIQFSLLPIIALLIYKLLYKHGVETISAVIFVVLVLPLPLSHWGLSSSYFWQWGEGQDKVLSTLLLLASFYLAQAKRPYLSGIVFGVSAFDPRLSLFSIPLFLFYNAGNVRKSTISALASFLISNSPLYLYPAIGAGFLQMVSESGIKTPLYYYTLIPITAILSLMIANWNELLRYFTNQKTIVVNTPSLEQPQ